MMAPGRKLNSAGKGGGEGGGGGQGPGRRERGPAGAAEQGRGRAAGPPPLQQRAPPGSWWGGWGKSPQREPRVRAPRAPRMTAAAISSSRAAPVAVPYVST
jgi:hypothetical protein